MAWGIDVETKFVERSFRLGRTFAPVAAALCGVAVAMPAAAQDGDAKGEAAKEKRPTVSRAAAPSPNATINLINLLVKQNVLSEEQAEALIKQAEDEAYVARQALRDASKKADGAEKTAAAAAEAVSPPGTKRVTYVPEVVKKQIREEIKQEVMAKAKTEGWAAPGALPEWVSRIRLSGDIRARFEGDFFPNGNDPFSAVNYNAINTGSPWNVNDLNPFYWPSYDTYQDRTRVRLRARLGLDTDLFDGFTAGMRIATGETNSPVSFNQTLGGSGGNFSKYAVWLDRAFIKYRPWEDVTLSAGRFDNPFFMPTDLVFNKDLGFDGFAIQIKSEVAPGITPFLNAGAFPVFNTDFNATLTAYDTVDVIGKFPSRDKWMLGAQFGGIFKVDSDIDLTLGVAYFDFTNVQGEVSSPCRADDAKDTCDTDTLRPSFAQKGNTYMMLRDIVPFDPTDPNEPQYQYFGLASAFRNVMLNGRLDLAHFDPIHIILDGEYVQNVAWDRQQVAARARANQLASSATYPFPDNEYFGGNEGWMGRLTVGHKELKELWDWNVSVAYKWLESDAVIDAFTDSDFGLGGTNLKGYIIGASLALGPKVWASARWMSANEVAGAPYAVDVLQVDLNAKF
ncbi:putative porin [Blastochloris tepida]|uniref:Porin n=1 Tax=Blastochloris tepida TaxID=2233851 RepID=A0A348G0R5_9HYPH|nr:hypothetical protein BLTE_18330 [Blastochloris tepida]